MRFESFLAPFQSLRFRLSAWNTVVVLLIVIVTLISVHEALRVSLISEYDHELSGDLGEVILAVEDHRDDLNQIQAEMDRKAKGHVNRKLFVQLLDDQGKVLASGGTAPRISPLPASTGELPQARTVGNDRMVERNLTDDRLPHYTVRVGASLQMVEDDLATVTRLMMLAGVAILFVAPLSGYLLAGRATRPLAQIVSTTARLRPHFMEERLEIRGTQDELDQLSGFINHFLDLLADYLAKHREFVANAAHELRSPLAAVQSSVEVTLNSDRTVTEYKDLLGEIADQCEQLRVLVNQLLLLAEADSSESQMEKQPVRVDQLVQKSIDMFRGVADDANISLMANLHDQVVVQGDGNRLRQVINNLIDNGLKYTQPGGKVMIALYNDPTLRKAVLKVADTGPGISPADLPQIFERFFRGDKSRQREGDLQGNGLGLSICESIVQRHGGTIQVESVVGRGSTFIVMLPLAEHAPSAAPARAPQSA